MQRIRFNDVVIVFAVLLLAGFSFHLLKRVDTLEWENAHLEQQVKSLRTTALRAVDGYGECVSTLTQVVMSRSQSVDKPEQRAPLTNDQCESMWEEVRDDMAIGLTGCDMTFAHPAECELPQNLRDACPEWDLADPLPFDDGPITSQANVEERRRLTGEILKAAADSARR